MNIHFRVSYPFYIIALVAIPIVAASAAVYVETINVPSSSYGSQILSERFARSSAGRSWYLKRTQQNSESHRVQVFTDRDLYHSIRAHDTKVIIDLKKQRAYLLANGRMALETEISTARRGKNTPLGSFAITERIAQGKVSNLYDVKMPYWMRLDGTAYGLHAGYTPGYPASAGCIRLPNQAAAMFFQKTQRGTPVKIVNYWKPRSLPIKPRILTQPSPQRIVKAIPIRPIAKSQPRVYRARRVRSRRLF